MTLADRITLARLVLAPLAVAAYLFLPLTGNLAFWVCGWICAFAEITDWLDGRVARARKEVSDFGKLADPFCDVFYRITIFLVYLLPVGGLGIALHDIPAGSGLWWWPATHLVDNDGNLGLALVPWIPVWLMVLREILAGALRAMSATKGLVLAARNSGKVKAWLQGVTLISACGMPAFFGGPNMAWLGGTSPTIYLSIVAGLTWLCAVVSLGSFAEYIWVNRTILRQLTARK